LAKLDQAANGNGRFRVHQPRLDISCVHPRFWGSWLFLGILWLCVYAPRPVSRALGKGLGLLFLRFNHKRKRIAGINLKLCFAELDPCQRRQMLRQHFIRYGQSVIDLGLLVWASEKKLATLTEVVGGEAFKKLLGRQKRIILFTPHHLGMDFGGIYASHFHPTVSMMKELDNPVLNWAIWRARTRYDVQMVLRRHGLRALLKGVKSGALMYYIPDEDFGSKESVFVPFFGVQTATLDTLGRLCRMADAVAVAVFAELKDDGGYRVYLEPPLENFPGDNAREDAAKMNQALEQGLRRMPEQYMWTLRWFKTRPEGEESPYGESI
jgi:lipid A biosynthesis lauroyl/palmitoleoyl acyltransferase